MNKESNAPQVDLFRIGGEVIGSSASLRVFGAAVDPHEITRLLRCSPSVKYRLGDPISMTVAALRKQGMWLLESPLGKEQELSVHISWLMAAVTPDPTIWKEIAGRFTADLYCALYVRSPNSGAELTCEVVQQVSARNLSIQFDLYVVDEEM